MTRIFSIIVFLCLSAAAGAQHRLVLDSCRAMALRNNKQISIAEINREIARDVRKSARTKYLPQVNAVGAYVHTTRNVQLLSDEQQAMFNGLGSLVPGQMGTILGLIGTNVVDGLEVNTRNVYVGSVTITQPVFMGGSIIAMNKMARLNEELSANSAEVGRQAVIYDTEKAYWMVVSLAHKKRLAESYLALVKRHDADVERMIGEGVATKADGLSVKVKVNEAEMTLSQVDNGLALSRMLLCQLCGLPLDEPIMLEEEQENVTVKTAEMTMPAVALAQTNRPELRSLQNAVDMSHQMVNIARAGHLPKVMLAGGYTITNPNMFNGFANKFAGMWNIGVMVHIPVWNWGDVRYKVRAAKSAETIARLELAETREKIELQSTQSSYKLTEAFKRLAMADRSIAHAEENLRSANLGFNEGVMPSTTVLEAQTAWLQAKSQKIDAEMGVRLAQTDMKKSLGILGE